MVFDAHERAFAFFKGACTRGIYDNMKTAVDDRPYCAGQQSHSRARAAAADRAARKAGKRRTRGRPRRTSPSRRVSPSHRATWSGNYPCRSPPCSSICHAPLISARSRTRKVITCVFHGIRPLIPATSDQLFHGHPTGRRYRSEARSSWLNPGLSVKGGIGAEGFPREGPARPTLRPPRGWRCRALGRGLWATRGRTGDHSAVFVGMSCSTAAPDLRSDGPSRAMR